jgi:hypothetical protein
MAIGGNAFCRRIRRSGRSGPAFRLQNPVEGSDASSRCPPRNRGRALSRNVLDSDAIPTNPRSPACSHGIRSVHPSGSLLRALE